MQEVKKSTAGTSKNDNHGRVIYLETYGWQMDAEKDGNAKYR